MKRAFQEIRLLPPLAVSRLGDSPEPVNNYELEVDPNDPLGFRKIKSAPSQTFPLKDAAAAHRALESRGTTGATVLLP